MCSVPASKPAPALQQAGNVKSVLTAIACPELLCEQTGQPPRVPGCIPSGPRADVQTDRREGFRVAKHPLKAVQPGNILTGRRQAVVRYQLKLPRQAPGIPGESIRYVLMRRHILFQDMFQVTLVPGKERKPGPGRSIHPCRTGQGQQGGQEFILNKRARQPALFRVYYRCHLLILFAWDRSNRKVSTISQKYSSTTRLKTFCASRSVINPSTWAGINFCSVFGRSP